MYTQQLALDLALNLLAQYKFKFSIFFFVSFSFSNTFPTLVLFEYDWK